MGDSRRANCRVCGKHRDEVGELSWTGLCPEHSISELESNVQQMVARSGPNFDRWRRRMAASVGGVLLDETPPAP